MTPALRTLDGQARHYATVRSRLWPTRRIATPKRPWSTPSVTQIFHELDDQIGAVLSNIQAPMPTAAEVIRATASVFKVGSGDITGSSRRAHFVKPRQIAMAVAAHVLKGRPRGSLAQIGVVFGCHYATIYYAAQRYGDAVERAAKR